MTDRRRAAAGLAVRPFGFEARLLVAGLLTIFSGAALAQAPAGLPTTQEVGVVSMRMQAVPRIFVLPGRAVAYEQVDIRPRVSGVVTEILYSPGQPLEVGNPLFQLDDANYQAAVAADEADLAKAEANLPVAQAAFDRASKLEGTGYTQAEVESARATLAEAKATLDAARSALDYARTELSWTTIKSPIQGFAEVANVSVGDLVTSGQSDALTTVTRLDPIYVDVIESASRILTMRQLIDSGALTLREELNATLTLDNGEVYTGTGTLVTPSWTVSTTTGTLTMRFLFDNPERKILPGMFLRGSIDLGTIQAFLVPQRAAERATDGSLTAFIVGEDSKSKKVTLTSLGTYDNSWIVTAGLSEGDELIVDGLKDMRAGTAVSPVPATVDENGLVQDTTAGEKNAEGADTPAPAGTQGGANP